jgi:hypothetical protein
MQTVKIISGGNDFVPLDIYMLKIINMVEVRNTDVIYETFNIFRLVLMETMQVNRKPYFKMITYIFC